MEHSTSKKILFIVEGDRDKTHTQKIVEAMKLKAHIFNVKANIYMLYTKMKKDSFQLNISDALLEMKGVDEDDKEMLRAEAPFTYTYLFFDLDPQHNDNPAEHNMDVVSDMLKHFNNETDDTVGKLYINYPMIESLWDYDKKDIDEFATRAISMSQVKWYKQIVGSRGSACNISKYDISRYSNLALLNIKKANRIVRGFWEKPDYSIYVSELTQDAIAGAEIEAVVSENIIYVLSSMPLFIVDYWGKNFYDSISES